MPELNFKGYSDNKDITRSLLQRYQKLYKTLFELFELFE